MRPAVPLLLIAAVGLGPSPARGGWDDLVPRPRDNGAYVDVFGAYERDSDRTGGRTVRWTDLFFREKLTLYSDGYFYHPRFLLYHTAVSGALKQEIYDVSTLAARRHHGTGFEYDVRFVLLPEHPYHLEVFALRYEPLFREHAATERNSEQVSRGARFEYRKKPLFFHARYDDDTIRSGVATTRVTRTGLSGQYFRRFEGGNQISLSAEHDPSRFHDSMGLSGDSRRTAAAAALEARRGKLNLSATRNDRDQTSPGSGRIGDEQEAFYESLIVYLPLGFRTESSYRYDDTRSFLRPPGATADRVLSSTGRELRFDLIHRLYESLDTSYRFRKHERTSGGGESKAIGHTLTAAYTKTVPRGRILLGMNAGRQDTETRGRADVVQEPHPATPVPGTFLLGQQDVEASGISVFLRSPLPPFDTVELDAGVHYTVSPLGNTFEVSVFGLPPQFAVPGSFDLLVSYSLRTGDFELRTDTTGASASVQLLDDLLTPFVSTFAIHSEVLSGVFPGNPLDSRTTTAGVLYHRGPWRARTEYQVLHWDVSPYRAWRSEVQYVGAVGPQTTFYGTGSYTSRRYPQGRSDPSRDPYSEEASTASANLQRRYPSQGLLLAAGATLSRLEGLVDTNAFSMSSTAMWKIGKLDVTLGASVYGSDSRGATTPSNRRAHELYYVKLRRRI